MLLVLLIAVHPMETSQLQATAKAPRSWAEDLNTYREARGSRSHATLRSKDDVPARCDPNTVAAIVRLQLLLYSSGLLAQVCENDAGAIRCQAPSVFSK